MQLEILSSDKINKQQWDDCVKQSSNSLIYATSAYLDHMADNWDGIIGDDYKLVMPVPWRKKFGIKYCYDVPFVQQLGLFASHVQEDHVEIFKTELEKSFRYGNYSFNYANINVKGTSRNNYILLLSSKYDVLKQFYSTNLAGNLSRLKDAGLKYQPGDIDEAIDLFRRLYAKRFPHVREIDYSNFTALCKLKEQESNLIVRKVVTGEETLSAALFLKDARRIYNLMPSTTENGRRRLAGPFLFDGVIKEFSHAGMILDFEGSDIPGVEAFYSGFGAVNQPYFKLHVNRLPVLLRILKR